MPRQLPGVRGIQRIQKSSRLHEEVIRNLQDIADLEDKSFSWVIAEIVYKFFGLEIDDDFVKVARSRRKTKARARNRHTSGEPEQRKPSRDVLRFEARGDAKRTA